VVPTILDGVVAPFGPATINNETNVNAYNVSVGFDVAPGLKWYGEFTFVDYETNVDPRLIALYETAAGAGTFPNLDNESAVFITGMYVSF